MASDKSRFICIYIYIRTYNVSIYIYIFRLIAWDLLRLSKDLFHCPVLILFGVIHEALGVTMQLPAASFFGCLQVLGIRN